MFEAIWATAVDRNVMVLSYLGIGSDGRHYVNIVGSETGVPMDELRFVNSDDPLNPFTSVWIDTHGNIHMAE